MGQSNGFLKRHALVIGTILMFVLTWPTMLGSSGLIPFKPPFVLGLFAGWGIILASLLMTWLTLGRAAVGELLRRYLMWRVVWKWYLALLLVPLVMLLSVYLAAALTGMAPDFSQANVERIRPEGLSRLAFLIPFFLTDVISNGEEIGWRGYVLPRLQSRWGALAASLITGVIWAVWHIPLLLNHWDWGYFGLFVLDTTLKSVLLAWIYNGTRGSLLLVVLAHAAWNTAGIYLPLSNTLSSGGLGAFAAQAAIEVLLVIVIVGRTGAENLSRSQPRQVQA